MRCSLDAVVIVAQTLLFTSHEPARHPRCRAAYEGTNLAPCLGSSRTLSPMNMARITERSCAPQQRSAPIWSPTTAPTHQDHRRAEKDQGPSEAVVLQDDSAGSSRVLGRLHRGDHGVRSDVAAKPRAPELAVTGLPCRAICLPPRSCPVAVPQELAGPLLRGAPRESGPRAAPAWSLASSSRPPAGSRSSTPLYLSATTSLVLDGVDCPAFASMSCIVGPASPPASSSLAGAARAAMPVAGVDGKLLELACRGDTRKWRARP
eukprot:scaffold2842_cov373-Prasinococcus_capsulatus_cf.AAC.3